MTKTPQVKSALTATQRTYMSNRLDAIADGKRKARHMELFGTEERNWYNKNFNPTIEQIVEALKKGKATIKKGRGDRKGSIDVDDDLDWSENELAKKEFNKKDKEYTKFCEDLAKKQQRIMDGVMLGTADDAMSALDEFAK